jgi:hypothetical protein
MASSIFNVLLVYCLVAMQIWFLALTLSLPWFSGIAAALTLYGVSSFLALLASDASNQTTVCRQPFCVVCAVRLVGGYNGSRYFFVAMRRCRGLNEQPVAGFASLDNCWYGGTPLCGSPSLV